MGMNTRLKKTYHINPSEVQYRKMLTHIHDFSDIFPLCIIEVNVVR